MIQLCGTLLYLNLLCTANGLGSNIESEYIDSTTTARPHFVFPLARKTTKTPTTTTTLAPIEDNSSTEINTNLQKSLEIDLHDEADYFCDCDVANVNCVADALTINCPQQIYNKPSSVSLMPCRVYDGWLCVFKQNIDNGIIAIYNADLGAIKRNFGWFLNVWSYNNNDVVNTVYNYGHRILLYNKKSAKIIPFELPFLILGSYCDVFEPVHHLQPFERNCFMTLEKAHANAKNLYSTLYESNILKLPRSDFMNEKSSEVCRKNTSQCDNINIYECREYEMDCSANNNGSLQSNNYSEFYSAITVSFVHNFTNLISCDVRFEYSELADFSATHVWQKFQTIFRTQMTDVMQAKLKNGRVGYITGQPIIADFSQNDKDLKYSSISLAGSNFGECDIKNTNSIKFAHNTLIKCHFNTFNNISTTKFNPIQFCNDLQGSIFNVMLNTDTTHQDLKMSISELANPKHSKNVWHKIEITNYEQIDVATEIDGDVSFTCENIINEASYRFYTGSIDVDKVAHQNVIKNAEIEFGAGGNIQFKYNDAVRVPIFISTTFYDLTDFVH